MLYGLKVAVEMLMSEGLPNVFARHHRHAAATRAAVQAWGLEVLCSNPREYSSTLTAVVVPDGFDAAHTQSWSNLCHFLLVRIEGDGTFRVDDGTNASADFGTAMLVGVTLPSPGCWRLTATYLDASLSIVVLVEGD